MVTTVWLPVSASEDAVNITALAKVTAPFALRCVSMDKTTSDVSEVTVF